MPNVPGRRLPGCKCSECFGFAEWAIEYLGSDYGQPHSAGHHLPAPGLRVVESPRSDMTGLAPGELAELQRRAKRRAPQPWDVAA